ncbi:MAG: transglycosylase family protein [Solirubrobacterales bacterium]
MNHSHRVASPKSKIVLALLAAAAMVVAGAVPTAAVADTSGGVSIGGESESEERSAKRQAKYVRLWVKVSSRDRHWARSTSKCESGRDPKAIGGGGKYRGAFQFLKSTWRHSPKSPGGDPIEYSYRTQAVVAVALKRRDGAGHWPNCG